MSKKINIYWDSYNGENDEYDYKEYDEFILLVKFGTDFSSTTFSSQKSEAEQNNIDNGLGGTFFTIDGRDFLTSSPNDENLKLEDFQTYKFTYFAEKTGRYFFSIWSVLDGKFFGPVYYPPRQDQDAVDADSSGSTGSSEGGVKVDDDVDAVDITEQLKIYALTLNGEAEGLDGSPASKQIGDNTSVAKIRNEDSPSFTYKASAPPSAASNLTFKGLTRATIREVSPNNQPSPNILYEFYDQDLIKGEFIFSSFFNSEIGIKNIAEGETHYKDEENSFVVTNKLKKEKLPLRKFDLVIEAYNKDTLKTSAGNVLHDNTINEGKEGNFENGGYDILEVEIVKPESIFFLNEYNDRESFVSPQEGFDRVIPYIIEPKLSEEGNIILDFRKSIDTATKSSVKSEAEIIDETFESMAGVVIYYADQPFNLNPEEINLSNGSVQKVTVEDTVVDVNRTFVLAENFNDTSSDLILSIPVPNAFSNNTILDSNIIIGIFDNLHLRKHFTADGNPIIGSVDGKEVESILGEKDLSFSKVAPPISQFNGLEIDGKNTFNKDQLTISSMTIYKKAAVDEGFRSQAFRCYSYIDVVNGSLSNVRVEKNLLTEEYPNKQITFSFKEPKDYIPVITPYILEDGTLKVFSESNDEATVKIVELTQEKAVLNIGSTNTRATQFGQKTPTMRIFVGFMALN